MKICCHCKKSKPYDCFGKLSSSNDGFRHDCKNCRKTDYLVNSEELKKKQKEYRLKKPHIKEQWNLNNYERNQIVKQRWYQKNAEKSKALHREWTKKNKHANAARSSKHRADKISATPKWLTFDQRRTILDIYKNCPKGYHVDHIVPLKGKQVCGLHVPWNLQHLPAEANLKKSNKVG